MGNPEFKPTFCKIQILHAFFITVLFNLKTLFKNLWNSMGIGR